MWCLFEGGNLDQQILDIEDREIAMRQGVWMCSPDQDPALIRSHGMCVYADNGRTVGQSDGRQLRIFEHVGCWQAYEPDTDR